MTTQALEAAPEQSAAAHRPSRWSPPRHAFGVLGVAVLTFGAHLALVVQNWRLGYYRAFDSVIFDQAVAAYSRFQLPRVPLKGVYAGHDRDFLQLGDHFSPIHAALAPLYWIHDDVRALFVAQAAMYAVAAALIWRFARRFVGPAAAYAVAVCFGVSWGLQSATDVGYHELDWAVPLVAVAVERLHAGRHRQALVAAAALLLVKEEMGLLVAALGLLFFLRHHRWWGAVLAVVGPAWSALAIKVFVPAFGGDSQQYWSYSSLGPGPVEAAKFALTQPWQLVAIVVSTGEKQQLLLWLLAVALGACLLSPIALLAVPPLALRLLSDTHTYTTVHWQYNAFLMVIVVMAGVDGIARLARWLSRVRGRRPGSRGARALVWTWVSGIAVIAVIGCLSPVFPFSRLVEPSAWQQSPYQRATHAVVDQIPKGAAVEVDDSLGVPLTARTHELVLTDFGPHGSQYAVIGTAPGLPPDTREQLMKLKQDYLDQGYRSIWRQDDIWLLRR